MFTRQVTEHYQNVCEFMRLARQLPVPGPPFVPDADTLRLRAKLIFEECLETINALGIAISFNDQQINFPDTGFVADHSYRNLDMDIDLAEVVDGIADISVVSVGTLVACNVPDVAILREVDDNNLEKFGAGSYIRSDGKWMKPPGHRPPAISALLCKIAAEWKRV